MEKQEARDWIKICIAGGAILHPNQVRQLYEWAEYPVPPHLIPVEMSDEEKERFGEIGRRLFENSFTSNPDLIKKYEAPTE